MRVDYSILASEVAVPTGMNLSIAHAVSHSDLARFSLYDFDQQAYTIAPIEYLEAGEIESRVKQLILLIIDPLLSKLPQALKPLPLLISIPHTLNQSKMLDWLEQQAFSQYISKITICYSAGIEVLQQCTGSLDSCDVTMCVCVDSVLENVESLAEQGEVLGKETPWGVIPGEGAAGIVMGKGGTIRQLKIGCESTMSYVDYDWKSDDRRGCLRLARKAKEWVKNIDAIHSDMVNLRSHTEDLGFALSVLPNPSSVTSTNEWWGTIGSASVLATLSSFQCLPNHIQSGLVYLFDQHHARALIKLERPE
ncbi:hypothetical protein M9194_18815 [Vibrio sp. S4M6]|uniref:hypothetical protein n=1 Tax=Vibrio sinus TaxID=2946865 RepID=UPI00202A940B|nr:hypothetical protein [Vibrio sinus]MCL9783483.1 hypothetical protein [Vibrio sinus]